MRLYVQVDDQQVLFEGEVAELQYNANDEQVTVTGRFTKAPNMGKLLQQAALGQVRQNASVPARPDPPNVVRLPEPSQESEDE